MLNEIGQSRKEIGKITFRPKLNDKKLPCITVMENMGRGSKGKKKKIIKL